MSCCSCNFWKPDRKIAPQDLSARDRGQCRRHAPTRVADGHNVEPGWPPTLALDSCGDYTLSRDWPENLFK